VRRAWAMIALRSLPWRASSPALPPYLRRLEQLQLQGPGESSSAAVAMVGQIQWLKPRTCDYTSLNIVGAALR
jgi:hypothetical protein